MASHDEQPMIGAAQTQVKPFRNLHFSRRPLCYYPPEGRGLFQSESEKDSRPTVAMKLIDVTVPLDASTSHVPGNTPFTLEAIKRIARGDSSNVSTLHLSAHAGTHVDAPRHFFDDAPGRRRDCRSS